MNHTHSDMHHELIMVDSIMIKLWQILLDFLVSFMWRCNNCCFVKHPSTAKAWRLHVRGQRGLWGQVGSAWARHSQTRWPVPCHRANTDQGAFFVLHPVPNVMIWSHRIHWDSRGGHGISNGISERAWSYMSECLFRSVPHTSFS